MRVLVTGATGFVGKVAVKHLQRAGFDVRRALRKTETASVFDDVVVGEINGQTDWEAALQGMDVVLHLAGRAHQLNDKSQDPLKDFRDINTDGTLNLAKQAKRAGIKRFVFVSSIGVNGSKNIMPFTEASLAKPHTPYAQSKWEAELGLAKLNGKMEITIVRPPLVYGPQAPGNLEKLITVLQKGVPLPFGLIHNKRSMVGVDNLASFLTTCLGHPNAGNQLFLVADSKDISTPELIKTMGAHLNKKIILLPVPVWGLKLLGKMTGKHKMMESLTESLRVDSRFARSKLDWQPPLSIEKGLEQMMLGTPSVKANSVEAKDKKSPHNAE